MLDKLRRWISYEFETLEDPEKTFQQVKKAVGVFTGISVAAVSASFGMYYVQHNDVLRVFLSAMLGWSGYLGAHYAATGKFIHQKSEQHLIPKSKRNIFGGILGIIIVTGGITVWAISMGQADALFGVVGAYLFLIGYLIAHYEFCGEIL